MATKFLTRVRADGYIEAILDFKEKINNMYGCDPAYYGNEAVWAIERCNEIASTLIKHKINEVYGYGTDSNR